MSCQSIGRRVVFHSVYAKSMPAKKTRCKWRIDLCTDFVRFPCFSSRTLDEINKMNLLSVECDDLKDVPRSNY